ncbi:type II secretion system protein [Candidatus Omnitrophota bacterium]
MMNKQLLPKNGFTLVEVMIVIAIIAILSAIAMPGLLRARFTSNQALAKNTIRSMSAAAEMYAASNDGSYPLDMSDMTDFNPSYMQKNYCDQTVSGYLYTCPEDENHQYAYMYVATPVNAGTTGEIIYTVTTGGDITEEEVE